MYRLAIGLSFLIALASAMAAAVTGKEVLYAAERAEKELGWRSSK
jgi:hypothetical protein